MRRLPGWLFSCVMVSSSTAWAQSTLAFNTFVPGRQELARIDFSGFPLGTPSMLGILDGRLEVVVKDGVKMLRASARSSFLIKLPEVLPHQFTLEFDIVPKTCCNPEDLAFEGTPTINQGVASANVMWHRDHQRIVGGGATYDRPMPASLSATVPGMMTNVAFSMNGTTMRMFTNGVPLYTEDRVFARSRVLRVFLGGQNDSDQAVYLARLRIATNSPLSAVNTSPSSGSSLAGAISSGQPQSITGSQPAPGTPVGVPPTVSAPASAGAQSGPLSGTTPNVTGQTAATQPPSALTQASNPLTSPIPPITATNTSSTSGTQQVLGGTAMLAAPPLLVAGPTGVQAFSLSSPPAIGWGVLIHWLPLTNATSYRVTRVEADANLFSQKYGVSSTTVIQPIPIPSNLVTPDRVVVADPYVAPGFSYTYWVEGVIGGSLTAPSTIVQLFVQSLPHAFSSSFGFTSPLSYTVGGTKAVSVPWMPPLVTTPGSDVTWVLAPRQGFLLYESTHEILDPNRNMVSWEQFPMFMPLDGSSLPPLVKSVPKGHSGRLCISYHKLALAADKVCVTAQVP